MKYNPLFLLPCMLLAMISCSTTHQSSHLYTQDHRWEGSTQSIDSISASIYRSMQTHSQVKVVYTYEPLTMQGSADTTRQAYRETYIVQTTQSGHDTIYTREEAKTASQAQISDSLAQSLTETEKTQHSASYTNATASQQPRQTLSDKIRHLANAILYLAIALLSVYLLFKARNLLSNILSKIIHRLTSMW